MNNPNQESGSTSTNWKAMRKTRGRSLGGLVLIIVGVVLLSKQAGIGLPDWLFNWPMVLISIALYIGVRSNFRFGYWIILLAIGVMFLVEDQFWDVNLHHYFWPSLLIFIGLAMIIKSRHKIFRSKKTTGSKSDNIDSFALLGSCKKSIVSKNFQGGRVESIFAGTEISFMQADINGTAVLNFNILFGGAKIFVPQHWNVTTEISAMLGSVDDKRIELSKVDSNRTLLLTGMVIFGGVEILSY